MNNFCKKEVLLHLKDIFRESLYDVCNEPLLKAIMHAHDISENLIENYSYQF